MGQIAYVQQGQLQSQWCWAAVSVSISRHYDAGTQWTQCNLVQQELNQTTCCQDGSTEQCNQPWYLQRALRRTANLRQFTSSAQAAATVGQEIEQEPVGRQDSVVRRWRAFRGD
jgi:hypothetical protein